jgi:hypothetical protein
VRVRDETGFPFVNGSRLPAWVKITVYLVGAIGSPLVFAGYFMAQNAGWIRSPVTEARDAAVATREAVAAHTVQEERRNRLLRLICRNTARTAYQADACDE